MSEKNLVKQYRELRRMVRRAKGPELEQAQRDLQALAARMTPKQLEQVEQ